MMRTLSFKNIYNFIDKISSTIEDIIARDGDVAIIAKYDEARQVIEELIGDGYPIVSISLNPPDFNEYYDEYIVSITEEGTWCEPMRRDDESTAIYILEDCSSKVISHCKSDLLFEVQLEDIDEDDEFYYNDCDLNECLQCGSQIDFDMLDQNDMHGFTVEKSDDNSHMRYSLYTTFDLDKADIQDILKNAGF